MATPRQLIFIDEVAKNHVKYYDPTLSSYLKLRQDLLKLYTSIQKQVLTIDADEDSSSKTTTTTTTTTTTSNESHTISFKLHQLEVELHKVELTYRTHIEELLNRLRIEKTMKPDILTGIQKELDQIIAQNDELQEKISRIKTVEKPLLEKITKLVNSFNNNIEKSRAKPILSSYIKSLEGDISDEQKEKDSLQVDFKSLVFSKDELRSQLRQMLNDELANHGHIDEILRNGKTFDEYDENKVLYKLYRSTLFDISQSKTLDEYDEMIAKTVEQIQTLQNEGESTKQSWNKNAEKILKIKAIVNEDADQQVVEDVDMTEAVND
ncbi:hypothetical protein KGF57_004217 [Candida theae]|uniref:Uncharacterized protein n=1 Tax=Candida theae TaxID=1198502 RepID=A0AAD5FX11_9ASCO|nr:uncharacterized protein KGF57_004217 [Candida theae]KAI5952088.1 hypothetical protein KGF57_004217 [Candida theae]